MHRNVRHTEAGADSMARVQPVEANDYASVPYHYDQEKMDLLQVSDASPVLHVHDVEHKDVSEAKNFPYREIPDHAV